MFIRFESFWEELRFIETVIVVFISAVRFSFVFFLGIWRKLVVTGSLWSMGSYRVIYWLISRRICCFLL